MLWLQQNTAADIVIGSFVDDTDGKTPETGLTILQADILLMKAGGASAQKNESSAATHRTDGHYKVSLNANDTDTVGPMRISVNVPGALPVWLDCMVVPSPAGAVGAGGDLIPLTIQLTDTTLVQGATVWISRDSAGADLIAGPLVTNGSGRVDFMLDDGEDYYAWRRKDGVNFTSELFTADVAGVTIAEGTLVAALGTTLVSDLFDDLRQGLRDPNTLAYPLAQMVGAYNRTIEEVQYLLMHLGSDAAVAELTITGDGSSQEFALPGQFVSFIIDGLRPRSPITGTSNYTHGRALAQVDRNGYGIPRAATAVGTPSRFHLYVSGATQYIRFDCIPTTGYIFDGLYYQAITRITVANYASQYTPWLGLLDPLIKRTMELILREGLEYTIEAREAWRVQNEDYARMLLGMRHLQTRIMHPSLFKGL